MTEVLEYCMRSIVRYLDGDKDKFNEYVEKAIEVDKRGCKCGGQTIHCNYNKLPSRICTSCGRIWRNKKVVSTCLVNSRRVG